MNEAQSRAARALLGWSQVALAQRVKVAALTIKRMEAGNPGVSSDIKDRARAALEAAGVIFVEENGEGPGVRLRKERPILDDAETFDGKPHNPRAVPLSPKNFNDLSGEGEYFTDPMKVPLEETTFSKRKSAKSSKRRSGGGSRRATRRESS